MLARPVLPATLAVCALALLLRLWGIGWGLPDASRAFSYHPDESMVTAGALAVKPLLLLLDTGFYNYGEFSMLVAGGLIQLAEGVGALAPSTAPGGGLPPLAVLLTRLVSAACGVATCALLVPLGRALGCRRAGVIAAGLYAVAPLAVQHGHFATVDVPATLCIVVALLFAARHGAETTRPRALLWCGVWSGLAAATKYNAGLALLAGLAAWWLAAPRTPRALLMLLGGAAAGFLVGCPGALINFPKFWADLTFELGHARSGSGDIFVQTLPGFVHHLVVSLFWGLGAPLWLLALVAVVAALVRRDRRLRLLAAFALPYYLLIGLAQIKFARYTLPLLPPLCLLAGFLAVAPKVPSQRRIAQLLALIAGGGALLYSLALDAAMARPDPRDAALADLKARPPASVGFATGPWWYHPPLVPGLLHPVPPRARQAAAEGGLIVPESAWSALSGPATSPEAPEALVLSEFEWGDALRIGRPEARAWLDAARAGWTERRDFASPIRLLGVTLVPTSERAGLPVLPLPHDMLYPYAHVVVLRRSPSQP